ncbi:MAG: DNA helicase, partial [Chitinophagaceae bacterium]
MKYLFITISLLFSSVAFSAEKLAESEAINPNRELPKILYLAFNKTVRREAKRKFSEQGLYNVQVETAHSLAFRHIVTNSGYAVCKKDYKTYEIAELLGLKGNGEKHGEYILANHISKFIAYFCNSSAEKVQDLNYLDTVSDNKAIGFVTSFYA